MNPPIPGPEDEIYRVILVLYQVGLLAFGAVYLSLRLIRGRALPGIRERLAIYPPALKKELFWESCPIWIHLVSVGEVIAARPLIEELRRRFPSKRWVITTVTATGRKVAEPLVRAGKDHLLYLPWDFAPVARRAVETIRPCLFLSFETELWPVLFRELGRQQIPTAVVNGRISPVAYRRYLWARPWMRAVLSDVGFIFAQSPQDVRRFAALGAAKDRIVMGGNLKWDLQLPEPPPDLRPDRLKTLLGLSNGALLWTAGSTHPGEEQMVLAVFHRLRERHPGLRLLIAPRHPERVREVEQEARRAGMKAERWSSLRGTERRSNLVFKNEIATAPSGPRDDVILLDTLGDLTAFYGVSDVVFVGGSLVPHGGHNLVEPAALSRPILTGPHLHNFQAISEALAQASALAVVRTEQELEETVDRVLKNPGWAKDLGARARRLIEENRGSTRRTVEGIALKWGARLAEPQ